MFQYKYTRRYATITSVELLLEYFVGLNAEEPIYNTYEIVSQLDEIQFEFIPYLDRKINSGTVFINLPTSDLVAFNFYTYDLTVRDRRKALINGTYRASDFTDDINNITIRRPIKDVYDIMRMIRCWLKRYLPFQKFKSLFLLHDGLLISI